MRSCDVAALTRSVGSACNPVQLAANPPQRRLRPSKAAIDVALRPDYSSVVSLNGISHDVPPVVPDAVLELAASCVRFVHAKFGIELDFTHETLPILDHYASEAREELKNRPEATTLLVEAMGAYFGQVLAIEFGGMWKAEGNDVHAWRVCLQSAFISVSPLGVAYDVLHAGQTHAGPSSELGLAPEDKSLVEGRLAALPPVREEEFFTFSARYDVFHIAFEALRNQMQNDGLDDVWFELGDYED